MSDRWDDEDERDRLRGRTGRAHDHEQEEDREPTLAETIDASVRKLVTGIVIAGGLIALGTYGAGRGGGDPSVDFQIATTPDGKVYRLDSEEGRIIACQGQHCWRLPTDRDEREKGPPAQAVPAQPAPAQLPAPANTAAPATR
jgi:hypothetical protein